MKPLLPNIWQWSWFSEEKQLDFNGLYLTVGEHRVVEMETVEGVEADEALRLAAGNPRDEEIHRFRIEAVRRQCPTLLGFGVHGGQILSAEFSPDGERIVTAGDNGDARVWNVATSQIELPPLKHGAAVLQAVFSPDGRRLATTGQDATVRLWRFRRKPVERLTLRHQGGITKVAYTRHGARMLTCGGDATAKVWDAQTGTLLLEMKHPAAVYDGDFCADDSRVVTASVEGGVRLWQLDTGKQIGAPVEQDGKLTRLEVSPDGLRFVTASTNGTAVVYSVVTGQPLLPPLWHAPGFENAHFSPDGRRLATTAPDGVVQIWDVDAGQLAMESRRHDGPALAVAFKPGALAVVSAGRNGIYFSGAG